MKIKVAFITKNRNDAVNVVQDNFLKVLRNKRNLQISIIKYPYNKNPLFSLIQLFSIKNITRLARIYSKSAIIHYSSFDIYMILWNPILKRIFKKKTILTVYHLEIDFFNQLL